MSNQAAELSCRLGDTCVLVLAPRGRNAHLIANTLARAEIESHICDDVEELCRRMSDPVGAVIICEEAFTRAALDRLVSSLAAQPPWSEVPVLVLTSGGRTTRSSVRVASALSPRGNLTLMERPVRIITLLSAVRTALRARRRQYEVRDLLEREHSARSHAEAASRAKDHFLATLSHELRTPLNPVLMTVSAMLDDPQLPEALREDVDLVRRNVELESKLIDDLLDLTRISRGKLELHHEVVDIHALLDHATHTCCESDMLSKRLKLRTLYEATRPYVWGDAARLSQVFWNLIRNAVKFTPEGGTITLHTRDGADGMLIISVSDTGIGIEPDAIGRIFDAFEQADRMITRNFGGLGLGLAITRALVDLHGGSITVESGGRNRGATFTTCLKSVAEPRPATAPVPVERVQGVQHLRILLVEDHEATAHITARLLRGLRHEVTIATDVAAASRAIEENDFDLVISDLGLPDGTGLDLMRHIRRRSRVPAIAVSGYGMDDDLRQSEDAGFDVHLVKPIDLCKLQLAIERVMRGPDN